MRRIVPQTGKHIVIWPISDKGRTLSPLLFFLTHLFATAQAIAKGGPGGTSAQTCDEGRRVGEELAQVGPSAAKAGPASQR